VCGRALAAFSGTAAGRAAHVEACLDAAAGDVAPPPPGPPACPARGFFVQPRLPFAREAAARPEARSTKEEGAESAKEEGAATPPAKRARGSWWGGHVRGGAGGGGSRGGRAHKPWRLVPGAPGFAVDVAGDWGRGRPGASYFLTHFHSDHYGGLSETFEAGEIHCTPVTARLVHGRLKVAWERLRPHPLGVPFIVSGVRCTFLDAHHCPGSAMVLFEPPGRRPVLHTGDCRCCTEMRSEPLLSLAGGRRVSLYLDTTYARTKYDFPAQADAVAYVASVLRREYSAGGRFARTLVLFGTYTIGKEKVFLHAAREFGRRVYVTREKRAVLDLLDLAEADAAARRCACARAAIGRSSPRHRLHVSRHGCVLPIESGGPLTRAAQSARAQSRPCRG